MQAGWQDAGRKAGWMQAGRQDAGRKAGCRQEGRLDAGNGEFLERNLESDI